MHLNLWASRSVATCAKGQGKGVKLHIRRVVTGDCHLYPQAWAHPCGWMALVVECLSWVPAFPGLAWEQLSVLELAACDLCLQIAIHWQETNRVSWQELLFGPRGSLSLWSDWSLAGI